MIKQDFEILDALRQLQTSNPNYCLLQFKSLVAARQYLKLYQSVFQYVVSGGKVLDWGCGNGHFSYYLLNSGYSAFGYSFSDFPLRPYLDTQGYSFTQGSVDEPIKLPYKDNEFDAVVSVGVLEHVKEYRGDDQASMKEVHRILKPGGYFICYHLPNRLSWIEYVASHLPNKYHHSFLYSATDILTLCQATNFDLIKTRRYAILPRNSTLGTLSQMRWFANIWDYTDSLLAHILSTFCQNYLFIARKPCE